MVATSLIKNFNYNNYKIVLEQNLSNLDGQNLINFSSL